MKLEEVCRACLSDDGEMINIFYPYGDSPDTLSQMLESLTQIKTEIDDELPKQLCEVCASHVNLFYRFKEMYRQSDITIRDFIRDECERKAPEEVAMFSELHEDEHQLDYCHNYMNVIMVNGSIVCCKCSMGFDKHLLETLKAVAFSCNQCEVHFTNWIDLHEHNKVHQVSENVQPFCKYCGNCFPDVREINLHFDQYHKKSAHFKCEICGEQFLNLLLLKTHFTMHEYQPAEKISSTPEINWIKVEKDVISIYDLSFPAQGVYEDQKNGSFLKQKSKNADALEGESDLDSIDAKVGPYVCEHCKKPFKKKFNFVRHLNSHQNIKTYDCKIPKCRKTFYSEYSLLIHKNCHHPKVAGVFACTICDKRFTTKKYIRSHMQKHRPDGLKCRFCDREFNFAHNLRHHERRHTGERPFLCPTCGKRFALNEYLKNHTLMVHGDKYAFTCNVCNKRLSSKLNLNNHMKIHSRDELGPRVRKTQKKAPFKEPESETKNILKNDAPCKSKIFICKICEYIAENVNDLDQHMITHTCKYSCPKCPKSFYLDAMLQSHLKSHDMGKRMLQCENCDYTTNRVDHLRTHTLRRHTVSEKVFKCESCEQSFAFFYDLKIHNRIHENPRPYTCKYCDRSFTQTGARNSHMRSHTGERPYTCEMCNMSFRLRGSQIHHMRTAHSDKINIGWKKK